MKQKDVKSYLVRGLAVVIGIFMVGIAVGFFKIAEMGADPFTAMNTGISSMLSIQFGTLQLGVNALILVLVFAFKRQFIGFGTIFNMVFVGYTADFIMWILAKLQITFAIWPSRIALLIFAALLICIGDALYISADMGMAPYDAAGYIVEMHTKQTVPVCADHTGYYLCQHWLFYWYEDRHSVENHRNWDSNAGVLYRAVYTVFPDTLE